MPRNVPFIGTALGDTLLAGPGAMRPIVAMGHTGFGQPREIFGQQVHVDRIGTRARHAFPAGTTEVVLVPWEFDAECSPVAWGRSARWLDPGTADSIAALAELRRLSVDSAFAGTYPVIEFLRTARDEFSWARRRAIRVPVAGTFRLVLERIGGSTTTAILRVGDGVTSDESPGESESPPRSFPATGAPALGRADRWASR